MELPNLVSLEEALKQETISNWTFYSAVTGHDWSNELMLRFGEIHSFEFNRKNRDQIYKLVEKLKRHYRQNYDPKEQTRQYYERHFDAMDMVFKSGKLKEQKEAIRELLTAIVLEKKI